jgi:hypothetical protein
MPLTNVIRTAKRAPEVNRKDITWLQAKRSLFHIYAAPVAYGRQ